MSGSENKLRLEIESGPERGRQIIVPSTGVRLGRDSTNDIVIRDPSISRFQCRIYHGIHGELRVADLGSTNTTELNGAPIQDVVLRPRDGITIGETVIRVIGAADAEPPAPEPAVTESDTAPAEVTDLGLGAKKPARKRAPKSLWLGAAAVLVLAGGLVLVKLFPWEKTSNGSTQPGGQKLASLDLQYEKIQASTNNIFRYELTVRQGRVFVRIDNLADSRHVAREQPVDAKVLERLALALENSGFFDLQSEYTGLAQDILDAYEVTLTLGARTHRCRVANRVEPEVFAKVRAMVEDFAYNELGMTALALAPEKLIERARDAMLQGQKLFDERGIKYGNLSLAMKAFKEADFCLETIDPKPDFYAQIISGREECKRQLQDLYDDRAFRAERAIKLRDWKEASVQLRTILELIPDRGDVRHQQAQSKLLDVERHLEKH